MKAKKRHTCFYCKRKRYEDFMTLFLASDILPLSFDIWLCMEDCLFEGGKVINQNTWSHLNFKPSVENVQRS